MPRSAIASTSGSAVKRPTKPKFPARTVRNIAELTKCLNAHAELLPPETDVWYRGQADESWKLIPSIARKGYRTDVEKQQSDRFKQNAVQFLQRRPEGWEWLFLMQHHGVPTRLLDWTESPLVALYFAVTDPPVELQHGALWALAPVEMNSAPGIEGIPVFGDDDVLDNYLPARVISETRTRLAPAAGIALRDTARMQAQLSVFTVMHHDDSPLEELPPGQHVWKYRIPAESKKSIRAELRRLALTRLTLFPELDNVAKLAVRGVLE
jgi:hypothetical protein